MNILHISLLIYFSLNITIISSNDEIEELKNEFIIKNTEINYQQNQNSPILPSKKLKILKKKIFLYNLFIQS